MKQKMLKVPRRRLIECAILFAAALMLLTSPSAQPVHAAGEAARYQLQIGGMT